MRAVTAMNAIRIAALLSFVRTSVPLRLLQSISPSKQNRCSFVHLIVELLILRTWAVRFPIIVCLFVASVAPHLGGNLSGRAAAPSKFLERQTAPEFGHACPLIAHVSAR